MSGGGGFQPYDAEESGKITSITAGNNVRPTYFNVDTINRKLMIPIAERNTWTIEVGKSYKIEYRCNFADADYYLVKSIEEE